MKKTITILLCLITIVFIVSCSDEVRSKTPTNELPSTVKSEKPESKEWSDFESWFFRVKSVPNGESKHYGEAFIIRDQDELEPLYEGLTEDEAAKVTEGLAKCDKQFFEDHTLVLLVVPLNDMQIDNVTNAKLTRDKEKTWAFFNLNGKSNNVIDEYDVYWYIALSTKEEIDIDSSEKIEIYYGPNKLTK